MRPWISVVMLPPHHCFLSPCLFLYNPLPPFSPISITYLDAVAMVILMGLFGKVTFTSKRKSPRGDARQPSSQNIEKNVGTWSGKRWSVTNKQKMRWDANGGFDCGGERCQDRWKEMVENNRIEEQEGGGVHKQTNSSVKHRARVGANPGETCLENTIWTKSPITRASLRMKLQITWM